MPLDKSGSKGAFSRNVAAEIQAGKPQDQALAIAYRIKRQRKRGGRTNYDDGGPVDLPELMTHSPETEGRLGKIAGAVGSGIRNVIEFPGRAMDEGLTTDQATDWAAPMALGMIGMGRIPGGAPAGAVGSGGAKLVQPEGIRAYHSSPYDFEKFDLSKIGTGEGAQSYGHGIYAAENPAVSGQGGQYWKSFAERFIRNNDAEGMATLALKNAGGDRAKAIDFLQNGSWQSNFPKQWDDAIGLLKTDKPVGPRTYELNINAKPEQMLDWDKPLAQQSGNVKDALTNIGVDPEFYGLPGGQLAPRIGGPRGQDAYNWMSGRLDGDRPMAGGQYGVPFTNEAAASAAFNEAGIPGIRYLDQGSRNPGFSSLSPAQLDARINTLQQDIAGGKGNTPLLQNRLDGLLREQASYKNPTHNYVVFDPSLIDIMRKYGLAGLPAGAGVAAASQGEGRAEGGQVTDHAMQVAYQVKRDRGGRANYDDGGGVDPLTGALVAPKVLPELMTHEPETQGRLGKLAPLVSGFGEMIGKPSDALFQRDAVKPEVPGQWSELDEWRQQQADKSITDWGRNTAMGMVGLSRLPGGAPAGVLGSSGSKLVQPEGVAALAPSVKSGRREAIGAVDLRSMPLDEAAAIANSERHIIPTTSGGYVGAPNWVKTPADLQKMRANFDAQVAEGLGGADWYGRAQTGIKEIAGPDPARQSLVAREKAQTSAQATPDANLGFALTMHNAYEAGVPLDIARTGQIARSYKKARDAGVDIPLGKKTGIYGEHLDPTRTNPTTGTNDIWHARSFDYRNAKGEPWDAALTPQQHSFMDAETVMAVDRANKQKLGGRSDWTAGEIQAAPWVAGKAKGLQKQFGWTPERARAEAMKTYPDFFDKYTAYGTHEATPGIGTGHLPNLAEAPMAERAAYAADPRSTWKGEGGRDVIYDALGMYTRPTREATGMYQSPGGPLELNPAAVARPLVGFSGKAGARAVDPASRAMMDVGEATRAYLDAQNAGAWSKPILNNKVGASNSLFVPNEGPMTIQQMQALKDTGAKYGLGDVIDYGQGAAMTNFSSPLPAPRALGKSLKGDLPGEISRAVPGAEPQRAQIDSGYAGYEKAWREPQGSGAVTRELRSYLENPQFPVAIAKLDASPSIRQAALARLDRDAELASRTGQPVREDLQLAREIIAKDGFSGLMRALQRGVALPAAALVPLAGLLGQQSRGE